MKKIIKRILIILLVILVVIQFIRPSKNIETAISQYDISRKYPIPDTVRKILQVTCYDCHSNNTRYPWYSNLQPVYWWLTSHVNDGKAALNFSDFLSYSLRKQFKRLEGISNEVKEGGMPISPYLWIHHDADLSDSQKILLRTWAMSIHEAMRLKYPPDSLAKRK